MTFGEYMKQAMREKNISQAELARRIGVNRSTVNGYVSGRRKKIAVPILNEISHVLGLDALVILTECTELDINDEFANMTPVYPYDVSMEDDKQRQEHSHRQFQLVSAFERLNDNGQTEAVKRVEELTEIPRYTEPDKQKSDSSQQEND